jgi:lysophospholipase L1-like esterase
MRNCLLITFFTLLLVGCVELIARLAYPEFSGHIHSSSQTFGQKFYLAKNPTIRVPTPGHDPSFQKPLIIILGDSVSQGYGSAYEDIYWAKAQRLLGLQLGEQAPTIVSLSYIGNNLNDSVRVLRNFLIQHPDATVKKVIYQFNFNDILPEYYSREAVQALKIREENRAKANAINPPNPNRPSPAPRQLSFSEKMTAWRYEYLNHSVLFRLTQHYAGRLARKTSGTCQERGLDALGPYTWSYGSAPFLTESEELWVQFTAGLSDLQQMTNKLQTTLSVLVSPLLFHVDTEGKHPYYNHLNYDFSCARIDPNKRLHKIADQLKVSVVDPTEYIRSSFNNRLKEGNFAPFFFTADDNHLTPLAASLMGEHLYSAIRK